MKALQRNRMLGKYRIRKRIATGGFASVYDALDTIEGIPVALKVPHAHLVDDETLSMFRQEVRLCARLDHPNILPLKNAAFIDDLFVIASPLGQESLATRLQRRLSLVRGLDFAEQILDALAHAHQQRVIHCDVKPDNFVLFSGDRLRLADFGIAKVARATLQSGGSGTLGYMAPEQAMGHPSTRSDVFSCGLILYRIFSGRLPEWPFDWPPPGFDRVSARLHPDMISLLKKALSVNRAERFADAQSMLQAFRRLKARALTPAKKRAKRNSRVHWKEVRWKQFLRGYRKVLGTRTECRHCGGPFGETMRYCPWCSREVKRFTGETRFPARCKRCHRGVKLDWAYCAWCYGPQRLDRSEREYTDVRYQGRCSNRACRRRELMPFSRYCPWCRRKPRKKWPWGESKDYCGGCGWGVTREFWSHCPWCRASLKGGKS